MDTSVTLITAEDASKVQRRLVSAENVLKALLQTGTTDGSIIERKLTQLEEIILDIPEKWPLLAAEWNNTLVSLWTQYATGVKANRGNSAHSENVATTAASPRPLSPPSPHQLDVPDLETFSPLNYPHLSKDTARSMIAAAFSKFPLMADDNDIDALRRFLALVIKARNLVQLYWDDLQLECELINTYILPKLTRDRQQPFRNRPPRQQVFYGLVFVLQSALVRQHLETGTSNRGHTRICYFCTSAKHIIWKCPKIGLQTGTITEEPSENVPEKYCSIPVQITRPPSAEERYSKELAEIEANIAELLAEKPVSVGALQRQLSKLLGTINRIPHHLTELYNSWGDKAANLLNHFATIAKPAEETTDDEEKKKPTVTLPKETIRDKLLEAFDRFKDVQSGAELRQLLLLTAKAFKLTKPFGRLDPAFPADMFDYALSKLSLDLQERFIPSNSEKKKKSLIELLSFLGRQVESSKTAIKEEDAHAEQWCHFCRITGHNAFNCIRINERLCFNCFSRGHDWKRCNNPTLGPAELLDSI